MTVVTWVIWCFTKKLFTGCDAWIGMLSCWSCQSPVAHSCSLLIYLNSFHGEMFKLNSAILHADLLLYCSVILNTMATQYTCSLNGTYCPHWLVQWSHHCSCMCIPVHSPWLPGYIDVEWPVLIILTIAGLFLDRPYMFNFLLKCSVLYHNRKGILLVIKQVDNWWKCFKIKYFKIWFALLHLICSYFYFQPV